MTSSVPRTPVEKERSDFCKLFSDFYCLQWHTHPPTHMHTQANIFKRKENVLIYVTKWLWLKLPDSFILFSTMTVDAIYRFYLKTLNVYIKICINYNSMLGCFECFFHILLKLTLFLDFGPLFLL